MVIFILEVELASHDRNGNKPAQTIGFTEGLLKKDSVIGRAQTSPSTTSMVKKMVDQSWGTGIWDRAWGKVTNTRPGPSVTTVWKRSGNCSS